MKCRVLLCHAVYCIVCTLQCLALFCVWHCVGVGFSVLQSNAMFCSMYVAVCVLPCIAVYCRTLQCALCCSVLSLVAVCRVVLPCVAVCFSVL